jgi:hypothetical protein
LGDARVAQLVSLSADTEAEAAIKAIGPAIENKCQKPRLTVDPRYTRTGFRIRSPQERLTAERDMRLAQSKTVNEGEGSKHGNLSP